MELRTEAEATRGCCLLTCSPWISKPTFATSSGFQLYRSDSAPREGRRLLTVLVSGKCPWFIWDQRESPLNRGWVNYCGSDEVAAGEGSMQKPWVFALSRKQAISMIIYWTLWVLPWVTWSLLWSSLKRISLSTHGGENQAGPTPFGWSGQTHLK